MVLTAVLLDLDGTLFDHATAALQGQRAWFDALGRRSTPALEAAWTVAEQRHFRSWREGEISFDEQRRRRLREVLPLLGLPVGDDSELDLLFAQGYLRAYRDAWCAFDDVEPALRAIHAAGLRTAVLTNGTREQQNAKIDALGLTGRLGPVVTSEELGVAKPRPEAFLRVCDRLGVRPHDTLYVGDDHAVDVLAARAAGLRAVHLDRTGAGPSCETARMGSLRELAAHLADQQAQ